MEHFHNMWSMLIHSRHWTVSHIITGHLVSDCHRPLHNHAGPYLECTGTLHNLQVNIDIIPFSNNQDVWCYQKIFRSLLSTLIFFPLVCNWMYFNQEFKDNALNWIWYFVAVVGFHFYVMINHTDVSSFPGSWPFNDRDISTANFASESRLETVKESCGTWRLVAVL